MNSKTFCIAPWVHTTVSATGNLLPCCAYLEPSTTPYTKFDQWVNSQELRDLRQNLYNGTAVNGCRRCWEQEKYDRLSQRQIYNKEFARHTNLRALDTAGWTVDANNICTLDLQLGNLCNLKCVMCGGDRSSQLMTEYVQNKDKFDSIAGHWTPSTNVDFTWPLSQEFQEFLSRFRTNLKWIKFTGGEPTMIPYVFDFLSQVEHPEDITVSLITNGTNYSQRLFDTLAKFKLVWLNISLEGINEHNDLLRYKSKWAEVEKNILAYKQLPNVRFTINHVLQAFSVATLIPLLKWCEQHELKLVFTVLIGPAFLHLNTVEPERISQFRADLINFADSGQVTVNQDVIDSVLNILKDHSYSPALQETRLEYTNTLDGIRNTSLSKII